MNTLKYIKYKLVTDGRTLRRFINRGFINEAKYSLFPYIDNTVDGYDVHKFTCNRGGKYIVKYIDGNFYPLVYQQLHKSGSSN